MEDTRLPKCVKYGEMVRPGEKMDGAFPGHPRAFGTNAGQWTTAAQDKGEMAQNGITFHGEMDSCTAFGHLACRCHDVFFSGARFVFDDFF